MNREIILLSNKKREEFSLLCVVFWKSHGWKHQLISKVGKFLGFKSEPYHVAAALTTCTSPGIEDYWIADSNTKQAYSCRVSREEYLRVMQDENIVAVVAIVNATESQVLRFHLWNALGEQVGWFEILKALLGIPYRGATCSEEMYRLVYGRRLVMGDVSTPAKLLNYFRRERDG